LNRKDLRAFLFVASSKYTLALLCLFL